MVADPRPVIVAAQRSPIATAGGLLGHLTVDQVAAPVLSALASDVSRNLDLAVDDVILGNCMGPGGNIARVSALAAGFDVAVTAMTVDRQCASGLAAIVTAGDRLVGGHGVMIAGGAESASTAPWRMWPPHAETEPRRYERAPFAPAGWEDPDMGWAADLLAEERGISRSRQDAYAARSHARAWQSQEGGSFEDEITAVAGVAKDERPRAGFTQERLARFPPAFREQGTVTAANSCGVNDGSAGVVVVDAHTHARIGRPGLRILSTATAGVHPALPGLGIVPAASKALFAAGLTWSDVDVVEFNEAFAGQILACCDELGLDDARVCPQGGALALGHPWGASGAVLVVRLFSQLVNQGTGRIGVAAIAAGGGQGVAMVVESCR